MQPAICMPRMYIFSMNTAKFNEYAYLTGCTQGKRPAVITDSTPLLHLLSYSMGGEQGNDLLYSTITDIVSYTILRR